MGLLDTIKSYNEKRNALLKKIDDKAKEIERNGIVQKVKVSEKRSELIDKRENLLQNSAKHEENTIIFQNNFLIVGTAYECRKNPSKQRSDVLKKTTLKTPVHIEKYLYQGVPAYMIVNSKYNLDLGVLSAGAASWLTDYYSKGVTEIKLTDKFNDSFHIDVIVRQK